jgi:hypothetical protein
LSQANDIDTETTVLKEAKEKKIRRKAGRTVNNGDSKGKKGDRTAKRKGRVSR